MIGGMADTIRAVAKKYVMAPADVVEELTRISARLNHRQPGMTDKVRTRLGQLGVPEVEQRLLSYPQSEMQKLARKRHPSRADAIRYSVLLAIDILMLAPMRLENLAELDLDRHFIWPARGRGNIGIIIPRSAVKNVQPLEYELRANAAVYFQIYLDRFRPLLLAGPSTSLFPGRNGGHKRGDSLSKQIIALLKSEVGIAWHPHAFRHLAVKLYLRAHPGDYEGARRLLAHLSVETTIRTYEGMEMRPVVQRYDALIEALRGSVQSNRGRQRGRGRR
jgi:integrase